MTRAFVALRADAERESGLCRVSAPDTDFRAVGGKPPTYEKIVLKPGPL